ncbi:hypothetical protein FB645_006108 [Coemansia sp. IMI 203386]|nr:hypothetical protein FB645_006108 [Coemansia sp. IMI 203386]
MLNIVIAAIMLIEIIKLLFTVLMAAYCFIKFICGILLRIRKTLVWAVLTLVSVFATLVRTDLCFNILVAASLFAGVCGTLRCVALAIAVLAHKGLAWKTAATVEKRQKVCSTSVSVTSANSIWKVATPAIFRVFFIVVPGAMVFVAENAIWIIEVPRVAVSAHDYTRFTVVGWVNPMDFVGTFPAGTAICCLSFDTFAGVNTTRLSLGMAAPTDNVVERRIQAVCGVLTKILLTTLAVPAQSQVTFSAVTAVIRMARRPSNVKAVGPAMAVVAPRPLLVEHPVFVAAMGLVNPFALELAITIKVPRYFASTALMPVVLAEPSAALPNILVVESPAADFSAHATARGNSTPARGKKAARSMTTPAVEHAAPRAVSLIIKLWTRSEITKFNMPTIKQQTECLLARNKTEHVSLKAVPPTENPEINVLMTSNNISTIQQRIMHFRPDRQLSALLKASTSTAKH